MIRSRRPLPVSCILALALAAVLVVPWGAGSASAVSSGRDPQVGDWFSYQYDRGVSNGWGNYSGYGDAMTSHSQYEVTSVQGTTVSVWGNGTWSYRNTSGTTYGGAFRADLTFSLANRSYLTGIDPDYPRVPYESIWFWIPPAQTVGASVSILDRNFTVLSLDGTMWVGTPSVPRSGILLESTGSYLRHDAYGTFDATFDDRWLFEPSTGYVLAEQYTEDDNLGVDGFHWVEAVTVTGASYPLPLETLPLLEAYGIPLAIFAALLLGVFVGFPRLRSRSRSVATSANGVPSPLRLRRIRRLTELDGLTGAGPSPFAPFFTIYAERAVWQRFPVIIGTAGSSVHALLAIDRESKIASLFAPDLAVARTMLSMQPARSYFVDAPDGAGGLPGTTQGRFVVLGLDRPVPQVFDPERILPMRREHLSQVAQIAKDVYWGKTAFWVQAAFEAGDIGFVATEDHRVVGFGFASVSGDHAQLHTASVTPAYRSRGIGGQLVAARLTALSQLGVQRVIAEVSDANVPSLRSLRSFGFTDVGVIFLVGKKRRVQGVGM